jgi:DNA-binding NtrC family response regulator
VFLFAKFANDFADKYKTPPIELTADALDILREHYWHGNIRQLKNIVEQISILETERLISAEMVKMALPQETTSKELIAFDHSKNNNEGFQERDLIYKFLFDIKRDLGELKAMMFQMAQHSDIKSSSVQDDDFSNQRLLKSASIYSDHTINPIPLETKTGNNDYFDEHTEINELPENLSLLDKEKEMIKEALIKHKGRRKPAAKELGISERTLYRKIKEYELEYL